MTLILFEILQMAMWHGASSEQIITYKQYTKLSYERNWSFQTVIQDNLSWYNHYGENGIMKRNLAKHSQKSFEVHFSETEIGVNMIEINLR